MTPDAYTVPMNTTTRSYAGPAVAAALACAVIQASLVASFVEPAGSSGAPDPETLVNEILDDYHPCAGSPIPAVCRCALMFPPVTYDTDVEFSIAEPGSNSYSLETGRTLMNLVRAIVVAAEPGPGVKLYANPPATPDAFRKLETVVARNAAFDHLELVKVMMLPRQIGGRADRIFGAIWLNGDTKELVVIFRGTQTPFEWYLDLQGGSERKISNSFDVVDGFGAAYQFCQRDLLDTIAAHSPTRVVIGGHSLGGAVAGIAAFDLYQRSRSSGSPYEVYAMTFGQPRIFSPASADQADAAIASNGLVLWRVVNIPDPCPPGPPAAVTGDGVKFKHTAWVAFYDDDVSALPGKDAAWNHHFYYDGYFDPASTIPMLHTAAEADDS